MSHITAGDITPIGQIAESTYGTTPAGAFTYLEDVREGGNITPTDNPNPYINYRYTANGKRTFDAADYVSQQKDAGYNAAVEVRDTAGWSAILQYGGLASSDSYLASLPSRSVQFGYKQDSNNTAYALTYRGCKTDQLKIAADAPGGIVKFDEVVMAAIRDPGATAFVTAPAASSVPAVQWIGAVNMYANGVTTTIYPQSFTITIKNNLARSRAWDTGASTSKTVALLEGRQEIEMELTLWMEDFAEMLNNMDNTGGRIIALSMGTTETVTLTGTAYMMADGTNHALVQDQQVQTVRLRLSSLYYTVA